MMQIYSFIMKKHTIKQSNFTVATWYKVANICEIGRAHV